MQDQLEMMLQGAIAMGKDVRAEWSAGLLTRIKTSDPVRGRRIWKVMDIQGGVLRTVEEMDNSDQ